MNGINLSAPHGWLMWKGKKMALASPSALPVGEKVVIVSIVVQWYGEDTNG